MGEKHHQPPKPPLPRPGVRPSPSMAAADVRNSWFAVPTPIRRLFLHFPLQTYAPEPLPLRSPEPARRPRLYVFARDADALAGLPSYNPTCLKWQTFLRIAGVQFDVVSSNNHASPSGSLPFLICAAPGPNYFIPLTGEKIGQYAKDHAWPGLSDVSSPRLEAYEALLTQTIRPAWLHALYLNDANITLVRALYLPSSPLLSPSVLHTVRTAATSEILNTTRRPLISPSQLRADLLTALGSLSTLLGTDQWFFGVAVPSLFDAEVFAYTHLILDQELGWRDGWLAECVREYENLVRHRDRLYQRCWG